jgi:signal transduction histidine kinase
MSPFQECKKYQIPFYRCPSFIFLTLGTIIIFAILTSYYVGNRIIDDPLVVALICIILTVILLILSYLATKTFEVLIEASRLKSEFISLASHQLRTPISNLKFAIEILMSGKKGKFEPSQLEYLQILKENTIRLGELTRDLLLISKIESGNLKLKREEFDLCQLTEKIVRNFSPFARAHNVDIKCSFQDNIPKIFGDQEQIKGVIETLLDNAIKYSKKEKSLVEIKIGKKKKEIYFEIKDEGIGIPQSDQKRIFEKFFRASNVSKSEIPGTGLGLFIAKSIIERSGGKIYLNSEEGKGTTVSFTLPLS